MRFPLRPSSNRLMLPGQLHSPAGLVIDWTHPLTAGLQACCIPNGMGLTSDLAIGHSATATGLGLRPRGPSVQKFVIADNLTRGAALSSNFSVAVVGFQNASLTAGGEDLFGRRAYVGEANNQGWAIYGDSTPRYVANLYNNTGSPNYVFAFAVAPVVNQTFTLGMTTDGTTLRTYAQGNVDGATTSGNVTCAVATSGLGSGQFYPGTATELQIGCVWSRVLSAQEMRQFHFDPFCFLVPLLSHGMYGVGLPSVSISQQLFLLSQSMAAKAGPAPNDQNFSWRTY